MGDASASAWKAACTTTTVFLKLLMANSLLASIILPTLTPSSSINPNPTRTSFTFAVSVVLIVGLTLSCLMPRPLVTAGISVLFALFSGMLMLTSPYLNAQAYYLGWLLIAMFLAGSKVFLYRKGYR